MNSARYFALAEAERYQRAAKEALLRRLIEHYKELGKREFIFYGGEDEFEAEQLGFRREAEGVRWLFRSEVVPAWLSHLEDLLGVRS